MKEIIIERAKTCCVSGHRNLSKDLNLDKLKEEFIKLIKDGYDTFLIGMAVGFDTVCFRVLEKLREEYNIKLIACVPCPSQSSRFNKTQKLEYDEMLNSSDEILLISEEYTKNCMIKRNDFLVKNSSSIVVYLRRDFGGTFYTYNKAKKENIKIIEI
jgi:uncharacterized phage-like protein YoqJ